MDIVERLRTEAQEWATANTRAQRLGKSQLAHNQCKIAAVLSHEAANEIERLRAALYEIAWNTNIRDIYKMADIARAALNNSN